MKINNISNVMYMNTSAPRKAEKYANPSFKGAVPKPVINGLSGFYDKVANSNTFQKFVKWFGQSDNTFTHLLFAESCFLSGFYMINTLRNKKIKKEQKPQMIINDTLTLGVSTAGAYFLEGKITNVVNKLAEKFFANHKNYYASLNPGAAEKLQEVLLSKAGEIANFTNPEQIKAGLEEATGIMGKQFKSIVGKEGSLKAFQMTQDNLATMQTAVKDAITSNSGEIVKAQDAVKNITKDAYDSITARAQADKILPGINKLKVLIILGLIYRFLGPVVITPIANKLSSKLLNKKPKKSNEIKK